MQFVPDFSQDGKRHKAGVILCLCCTAASSSLSLPPLSPVSTSIMKLINDQLIGFSLLFIYRPLCARKRKPADVALNNSSTFKLDQLLLEFI